jgi:hypothetical protein
MLNVDNNFSPGGIGSVVNNVTPQQLELAAEAFAVASIASLMAAAFMQKAQGGTPSGVSPINPQPFPPIAPPPPPQGMTTDPSTGTISFPDGTTVTQEGQYNWTVHNADGTTSTITGDPHVDDKDKNGQEHHWDFQQDSTFVLKNGARINVNTVPWGNAGAHVTGSLEVLYGNQRATVTGIDKGKGQVSGVTNDGYAHVNDMPQGSPVFVEDSNDSWTLNGQEIVGGSTLNGLKLGQNMGTLTNGVGNGQQWAQIIFAALETALLASFAQQIAQGFTQNQGNPYQNYASPSQSYAQAGSPQGLQNIGQAFADLGRLLQAVRAYSQLTQAQGKPVFA